MKENSKLILLHIGKGHKKYMYKSWEIGSLWFNSTTKLYLIKMLILSLCLPSSWIFFYTFSFSGGFNTYLQCKSWRCRHLSVPFHIPHREKRRAWLGAKVWAAFMEIASYSYSKTVRLPLLFLRGNWSKVA